MNRNAIASGLVLVVRPNQTLARTLARLSKSGIGILPVGIDIPIWKKTDRLEAYPTENPSACRAFRRMP